MRAARWALDHPAALRGGQRLAARTRRLHPKHRLPGPGSAWTETRDIPAVPAESFRDWWQRTRGKTPGKEDPSA
jgi:L-lactate dehydrogenase complex protein LldF